MIRRVSSSHFFCCLSGHGALVAGSTPAMALWEGYYWQPAREPISGSRQVLVLSSHSQRGPVLRPESHGGPQGGDCSLHWDRKASEDPAWSTRDGQMGSLKKKKNPWVFYCSCSQPVDFYFIVLMFGLYLILFKTPKQHDGLQRRTKFRKLKWQRCHPLAT